MVVLASNITMSLSAFMGSTDLHCQQQPHKPLLHLPNTGINCHSLSFAVLSSCGFTSSSLRTRPVAVTGGSNTSPPTSSDQHLPAQNDGNDPN